MQLELEVSPPATCPEPYSLHGFSKWNDIGMLALLIIVSQIASYNVFWDMILIVAGPGIK